MSDPVDLDTLVDQIHAAPIQIVLVVTGGGSRAIAELLQRPGGSRVLLEAAVPYSSAALIDYLDAEPEQFCSARTARLMAMAAYQRARQLEPEQAQRVQLIGLGCTASLASDRPKRGDHRIHVAFQMHDTTAEFTLTLVKDRRTRYEEENVAARLILNAISDACGGFGHLDLDIRGDEPLVERRAKADDAEQALLNGDRRQILVGRAPIIPTGTRRAIFPGAFNPLHDGHREMAQIARTRLNMPVEFELSIHNVDKPPLDYLEMRDRAGQFTESDTLWLTRAATFEEKSRLFPDATFIVGADTIARIADPAYYGGSQPAMLAAIDRIAGRGGRFLVFGRTTGSGQPDPGEPAFQTLSALDLPPSLRSICDQVPASDFRADVSSTQLRQNTSASED